MNMPFELGIDDGARRYGGRRLHTKRCLILGATPYDYHKALSDVSGNDIPSDRAENRGRYTRVTVSEV